MTTITLPDFAPGQPAARVDASLRQALQACDRARECAVLWFAEVQRRELHRQLGFASLQIYATQALGFSDNRYWQFKRLADDLDRLPALRAAVVGGTVGWTKAQQVARVATEETVDAWVAKAATTGRRELAAMVAAARVARRSTATPAGQLALGMGTAVVAAAGDPGATISLRADGLRLARFEALLEKARKSGLAAVGADRLDLVLAGLEALVAGPGAAAGAQPARAAVPVTQVIVQQCPDCGHAAAVTSRGEKELAPAQVAALACDARVRRPGEPNRATIPPKTRAAVLARDRYRCATPGCGATSFLEVHHVAPRAMGGANRAGNLVALCHRCHAFAHARAAGVSPAQVGGDGATADRLAGMASVADGVRAG